MTATVLSVISSIVLVLSAAAYLSRTTAHLVHEIIPLATAIADLRKAIVKAFTDNE
jgi:hypothetical protein